MNDTCSYDRKWGTGRKGVGERAELSCFLCVCVSIIDRPVDRRGKKMSLLLGLYYTYKQKVMKSRKRIIDMYVTDRK